MRTQKVKTMEALAVSVMIMLAAGHYQSHGSASDSSQQDMGSNTQGSQAVPLASGSDDGGQLPCNAGGRSGSVGGYQPVTDQDGQSSILKDLAPLAFQEYASTHNVTGCSIKTASPVSYNITKACKQVVAGTNYAFAFRSSYRCISASNRAATGSMLLNSIIYEPLPTSGQNAKPQVTKVWNATTL